MRESPRTRRLRSDLKALEQLKAESTILDFACWGTPPESYLVRFHGQGLWRHEAGQRVLIREVHEVRVNLGAAYPRMMPELAWQTPIYHPNISGSGVVCLGGYGTYWVPSLGLHELCEMLWDMIRYANYDVTSPYNREAALWARSQTEYRFPLDPRSLRDRLSGAPRGAGPAAGAPAHSTAAPLPAAAAAAADDDVLFLDDVIEAELIDGSADDDLFIIE